MFVFNFVLSKDVEGNYLLVACCLVSGYSVLLRFFFLSHVSIEVL